MKKKYYFTQIEPVYIYYNTTDGEPIIIPQEATNGAFDVPVIRNEKVLGTTTNQCRFVFYSIPTKILRSAFDHSSNWRRLSKFEIPLSIIKIETDAFVDCSELTGGGGTNTGMIYLGTSAQWSSVIKETNWWNGDEVIDAKVYCQNDNTYVNV